MGKIESIFSINRARQYGKTTTLQALAGYLKDDYFVLSMEENRLCHPICPICRHVRHYM